MKVFQFLFASSLCCSFGAADEVEKSLAKPVSFHKDIRPLFQANCNGCHQPAKVKGKYVMTNFAALLKGGDSGELAIVPGKPDDSYL
ncbi:uncharacterized protein METZ01_LOCUS509271, partial [marine metagenome]